ncbi:acylphosphatase [Deinococcus peraridilitoris]|nr:acylphosphatase [Deinococcus peraridilitoris]
MRVNVLISGAVQGVGYRRFVQRHALDLGLHGYAENLSDGRVEIVAEGERGDLERLLHWLRRGPYHAAVTHLDVQWNEATGLNDFFVY